MYIVQNYYKTIIEHKQNYGTIVNDIQYMLINMTLQLYIFLASFFC